MYESEACMQHFAMLIRLSAVYEEEGFMAVTM